MAKRGENIYLRKDGRYEGRYIKEKKEDGTIRWGYVYARQYKVVKEQLILKKAEQNAMTGEAYELQGDKCLGEWMLYWLEHIVRPYVKQSTYTGYRRNIEKYLIPGMGTVYLRVLRREMIQEFVNRLSDQLASGTVQNISRLLGAALREAQVQGVIAVNPCQGIRVPKKRKRTPRYLTLSEQQLLEKEIMRTNDMIYLICLYTGMRLGEICALTWEDVNFEEGMIQVRHTIQRISNSIGDRKTQMIRQTPKTEAGCREIPVPGFITECLKALYHTRIVKKSEYVFCNMEGNHVEPRAVQRRISRRAADAGIADVHMHTLRHTYATRCLEQNIGYETLSYLLGHSSPRITLQYYAHCTRENKKKCVERLSSLYGSREQQAV